MTPDVAAGTATPAPFLFELMLWFSVMSVIAWAWLSFVNRRSRVIIDESEPEPNEPLPTDSRND